MSPLRRRALECGVGSAGCEVGATALHGCRVTWLHGSWAVGPPALALASPPRSGEAGETQAEAESEIEGEEEDDEEEAEEERMVEEDAGEWVRGVFITKFIFVFAERFARVNGAV